MEKTLYDRLGGKDGITRLVDDAVDAHFANPLIKTRFENTKDVEHAKRMSVEFFCAGSGGPQTYTGRDMVTTHKGMNISSAEYMHVVDDILQVLDSHSIDEESKKDVLAILWSLKGMIIAQ